MAQIKAVQSVWFSENYGSIDYCCGWLDERFHFFSWALSSLLLSRHFTSIELVTDRLGAQLATRLGLPYTNICTNLEVIKHTNYLWMPNKIYSYSIQQQPFVHVDIDAYLFKDLDVYLKRAPLFAQNFEYDHDTYIDGYEDINAYFHYIPDFIKKDSIGRLTAVNAGIIGGTNTLFFNELIHIVNDFLDQNNMNLTKCRYHPLNIFVEQFILKNYADYKQISISYFSPIEFGPPCDYQMADFIQLPDNCGYIHLMNYKHNPTVCEQMAQRLWLESPELYERVLTVCRELEATHHPIYQAVTPEQIQTPFYRTSYILGTGNPLAIPVNSADALSTYINALPEGQPKNVLNDVFQYECCRQEFIKKLPEPAVLRQHWQGYSQQTNAFLALPVAEYSQKQIQQSVYAQRIESEWNWAEVNEFALQTADRDFARNLQIEPAYYEVVLYYYLHQGLVREHLLDALNTLILDAIEEPVSIASVIKAVCDQVLAYQFEVDQRELADTVMSRIRHFLYHGVLDVVA